LATEQHWCGFLYLPTYPYYIVFYVAASYSQFVIFSQLVAAFCLLLADQILGHKHIKPIIL